MTGASPLRAPIFIVGAGRSGTTLLRSLLSAHSRVAVTPETHFMAFALRHGAAQAAAPADADAFWGALAAFSRFHDLGVDPARCRRLADAAGGDFRAVFAALLTAFGEAAGKPRIGEKTPGHHAHVARLLDWFPDARVIFIRRDPRAVAASALVAPWVMEQRRPARATAPFVRRMRLWQVAAQARGWNRIYERHLPAVADDARVTTVAYERLATAPEGELLRLCRFLGEPFEPEMLSPRAAAAEQAVARWSDWAARHAGRAAEPVSVDSLERWRSTLSRAETAVVEALCARGMAAAGYRSSVPLARRRVGRALGRAVLGANEAEKSLRRALGRPA